MVQEYEGDNGLNVLIGELKGTLKGVGEAVKSQGAAIQSQGEESSRARGKMYEAINQIKDAVQDIDYRLKRLEERVSEISPETKEFTRWRERAAGAGLLGKFLWALGGIILSAAAGAAGAWQWFVGK